MSNVGPTPSSAWEEQLVNYLMGNMDPTGLQPSFYPGNLSNVWGYLPEGSDMDTGTTNFAQDVVQMQMDPALWAQAGSMAFDPMAFQPTTSYQVVDQPGTRALMQYLNRPGTIEYEIANEILNNGGTASSAIGKLQQAYNATGGDLSGLDPEEQALFSQLPTFQDMGQTVVNWDALFERGQQLEADALSDPQPGMSNAIYNEQGQMVSPGGQMQMMYDANGNPQLVEITSEQSPLGEWARENGLTPPDVEYTPEMILGADWQQQQQNYMDTQAVIDMAMQQWLEGQKTMEGAQAKADQIRGTQQFLEGLQPSPFGEGQTGARAERAWSPNGEGVTWGDAMRDATIMGTMPAGGWGIAAGANLAPVVGEVAGGARDLTAAGSEMLTNPAAASAAANPQSLIPGAASAAWNWLFGTADQGQQPPTQFNVQLQPGDVRQPLPQSETAPWAIAQTPTTPPASEFAQWGAQTPTSPPGSENAQWAPTGTPPQMQPSAEMMQRLLGQQPTPPQPTPTTAPQSDLAPWYAQSMLNYAYGPTMNGMGPAPSATAPPGSEQAPWAPTAELQQRLLGDVANDIGPPDMEYPRYQFAGGNRMFGQATGEADRNPNMPVGAGEITATVDPNTPEGRQQFWQNVFQEIVAPGSNVTAGGQPSGQGEYGARMPSPMERAMTKLMTEPSRKPQTGEEGGGGGERGSDEVAAEVAANARRNRPDLFEGYVPSVVTGEQTQPAAPAESEEETTTATGEVRRRRRRNAPTSAQLSGNSLVTPPQSEQRFMSGSPDRRGQIRQAQRDLWQQRNQIWGADYGRAAAIADWARMNGVTPFTQQMMARRMVPMAMGVPQTGYFPGR